MADEVAEIRSRINIVDLVGQTVSLKKTGRGYLGLCPFHQDHKPSFNVAPEMGRYKCWSCQEGGDIFDWVMKTRNVEFKEALEVLAEMAGVSLKHQNPKDRSVRLVQRSAMDAALTFFRAQLDGSKEAKTYCERRALGAEILAKWEIGYAPDGGEALTHYLRKQGFRLADCKTLFLVDGNESQGYGDKFKARLMFPIRDERGDLVAFGGRVLGDGNPKYINSSDTPLYKKSRVLYGMNVAKETMRSSREAVLVEGYLDVIACHESGVLGAVASLGTALSDEHAKLMRRWCDSATILYDSDAPGQKAAARAAEILVAEGLRVRVACVPEGKDPDTLLRAAGPEAVKKVATTGLSPLEYKIEQIKRSHDDSAEEFWAEVVAALAGEPDALKRLHFVEDLAPRYPKIRIAADARAALMSMVENAIGRSPSLGRAETRAPAKSATDAAPLPFNPSERVVFRAVLESELRGAVWPVLQTGELFVTKGGGIMARKIMESFPDGPPTGPPRDWLDRIADPKVKDLLLELGTIEIKMSREYLDESLANLRKRFYERSADETKAADGDNKLVEIAERLRQIRAEDELLRRWI